VSSGTQVQGSAGLSVRRTRRGAARVLVTFEIAGRCPVVHFGPEYPTEAQALDSLQATACGWASRWRAGGMTRMRRIQMRGLPDYRTR
jgi:hypothetical protein